MYKYYDTKVGQISICETESDSTKGEGKVVSAWFEDKIKLYLKFGCVIPLLCICCLSGEPGIAEKENYIHSVALLEFTLTLPSVSSPVKWHLCLKWFHMSLSPVGSSVHCKFNILLPGLENLFKILHLIP